MTSHIRPGFRRAAIVIFAILLPLAAHALWDYVEVRRLIREIAAIRDRGEPVAERDLGPTAPTSDEQKRASRLYLAAAVLTLDAGADDQRLATDLHAASPRLNQPSPERDELVRRLGVPLSKYAEAFPLLDQATPLDFSVPSPGTEYSYRTASLWSLGRVNSLRAAQYCLTGRADEAAEATIGTLRLRRTLRSRLSWSGTQPSIADFGFLLSHCTPSAAVLMRLQEAIDVGSARDVLLRDLMSERVFFIQEIWRRYGVDARAPEHFNFRYWTPVEVVTRPWLTHTLVRELRVRGEVVAAAAQPRRQRQERLASLARLSAVPGYMPLPSVRGLSATAVIETDVPQADARVTFANVARVAVAVERYRRDNRQGLPSALADLVPAYLAAVPVDPYSETTLLYRRTADGYTIYSVGPDLTDDGGDLTPAKLTWPRRSVFTSSRDLGMFVQTAHD